MAEPLTNNLAVMRQPGNGACESAVVRLAQSGFAKAAVAEVPRTRDVGSTSLKCLVDWWGPENRDKAQSPGTVRRPDNLAPGIAK